MKSYSGSGRLNTSLRYRRRRDMILHYDAKAVQTKVEYYVIPGFQTDLRSTNPVWNIGFPTRFKSPAFLFGYANEQLRTGRWTGAQADEFLRASSPAFIVPERVEDLACDPQTGRLGDVHDQAVSIITRLGLLGPNPTQAQIDSFSRAFGHGRDNLYPVGMYPEFVQMYCTVDAGKRVTGWNQAVKDWIDGKSNNLQMIDSEPNDRRMLSTIPMWTNKQRIGAITTYFAQFGIHYVVAGPRIDVIGHGPYIVGFVPGSNFESSAGLDLETYYWHSMMEAMTAGREPLWSSTDELREILYLMNAFGSDEILSGHLRYHQDPHGMSSLVNTYARGGVTEFTHLRNTIDPTAATYFTQRGIVQPAGSVVDVEVGAAFTRIFSSDSNIYVNWPDFILRLQVPVMLMVASQTLIGVEDIAAYTEEVTSAQSARHLQSDIRTMFLGQVSITRIASLDIAALTARLSRTPTPQDLNDARAEIYRGTTIRGLRGTKFIEGLLNLFSGESQVGLDAGSDRWLYLESIQISGISVGIRGIARIDDGDAVHPPVHVRFAITRDAANPNRFWMKAEIGMLQNYRPATPTYQQATFVPGSIWYSTPASWQGVTIDIAVLEGRNGNPLDRREIDHTAWSLRDWLLQQFTQNGRLDRRAMKWIRAHDTDMHRRILEQQYTWLNDPAWWGRGVTPVVRGELSTRFVAAIAANIPGIAFIPQMLRPDAMAWPQLWNEQTGINLAYLDSTFGMAVHALECEGVGRTPSSIATMPNILATRRTMIALRARIAEDFMRAGITATTIADSIIGDDAWQDMREIVRDANKKAGLPIDRQDEWKYNRHLLLISNYLDGLLRTMRDSLKARASDFTMLHAAVRQFLVILSLFHDGTEFPESSSRRNKDNSQKALMGSWIDMWKKILDGHGVDCEWAGKPNELYRSLRRNFQHALIYDWANHGENLRGRNILREYYLGETLSASVQLVVHCGEHGFQVLQTTQAPICDWMYSRVRFHPFNLQNQQPVDYIVRYRLDSNILSRTSEGFEVFASCSNNPIPSSPEFRDYIPSGGVATTLWNVIQSGQAPEQSGQPTLAAYLNNLQRMRVGGRQLSTVVDPNQPGLDMQSPAWVEFLSGLV